jgi:hypothetical protein
MSSKSNHSLGCYLSSSNFRWSSIWFFSAKSRWKCSSINISCFSFYGRFTCLWRYCDYHCIDLCWTRTEWEIIRIIDWVLFQSLGINSVGLSGTEKGLYDLGTYFGRLCIEWLIRENRLFSANGSMASCEFIKENRWLCFSTWYNYSNDISFE